jgi:ubiquinone/menaquinone biosynthesis C-methylase UbiE
VTPDGREAPSNRHVLAFRCKREAALVEKAQQIPAAENTARLSAIVQTEAMEWGDNVAGPYHGVAAGHMNAQWQSMVWPILSQHDIDFTNTMDFACGYGRNALKLKEAGAKLVTLVDVNPDNIAYCNQHMVPLGGFTVIQNNGFDLRSIPAETFTHVYSFDAMVHFDMELIMRYVTEFYRVLVPGGTAFIHHSNYTGTPGGDFRKNPHWRNFMSADIFKHIALRNGFEILGQYIQTWGDPDIDCISVLRRPA